MVDSIQPGTVASAWLMKRKPRRWSSSPVMTVAMAGASWTVVTLLAAEVTTLDRSMSRLTSVAGSSERFSGTTVSGSAGVDRSSARARRGAATRAAAPASAMTSSCEPRPRAIIVAPRPCYVPARQVGSLHSPPRRENPSPTLGHSLVHHAHLDAAIAGALVDAVVV